MTSEAVYQKYEVILVSKNTKMPLRAFINREEIISIEQSDAQWMDLKSKTKDDSSILTLPCCNQPGFLKTSKKGLRYFAHLNSENTCEWERETSELLSSKEEIIKACCENGWEAIPEFSENGWATDVLAIKNGMRIAFDVKWGKQTIEEIKFKQLRYKESKVRSCWLLKTPPKEFREWNTIVKADNDIPLFKIKKCTDTGIYVDVASRSIPLNEFIDSLLKRKIKFCNNYRLKQEQEVEIIIFETSCWNCKKPQHSYTVEQQLESFCHQNIYVWGTMWDSNDLDKNPQIIAAVNDIMRSEEGKDIRIGQVKERYSKTVNGSYLSFGCFHCDAILGDYHLNTDKIYGRNDPGSKIFKRILDLGIVKQEGQHWCFSETNEFCE